VVLVGWVLVHLYLWRRLVRNTRITGTKRTVLTMGLIGVAAWVPLTIALYMVLPWESLQPFGVIAGLWVGILVYMLSVLVVFEGIHLFRLWIHKRKPAEILPEGSEAMNRRVFMARAAAVTASATGLGAGLYGYTSVQGDIETPEIPIKLWRLPSRLDGFRIAHLTDMHIGPTLQEKWLDYLVEQTNGMKPDAVVITGDLVDGSVDRVGSLVQRLDKLNALGKNRVYYVTGNHEHFPSRENRVGQWLDYLQKMGVQVLANGRVSVGDSGRGGASFDLAGVYDASAADLTSGYESDPAKAVEGRDAERELVFLAHQPKQIDGIAELKPGLQISGHTHGGQINPFGIALNLSQPYLEGLHQHSGVTQVFVSRGAGYWGIPMRLGAPAEIPLLVLSHG
jgi:predicted MPP superfamily phosphohydrolase